VIDLLEIVEAAKQSGRPSNPLELQIIPSSEVNGTIHAAVITTASLSNWRAITANYFRRLLRLHTQEQREATNLFIAALHQAHPNPAAVRHILSSEHIRPHRPITAKQALRAYQKFVLLEETSYHYIDDGSGTNHKELKFMHGLVLKLKTFFR
jgi:hypothetical protein